MVTIPGLHLELWCSMGLGKTELENLLSFKLHLYDEQHRISTDVYRGAWTHAQIGSEVFEA